MEFSRDQIEEIKRRTSRYKADPVIFIEECIKVAHPVRGLVPLNYIHSRNLLYTLYRIIGSIFLESSVRRGVQP